MAELWLVRHGETEWSRIGRHTGRSDPALTAEGEAQARALAPLLEGVAFDEVWVSPLRRARDTCRLAGFGERARVEPALMEWDYGALEGRTREEVRRELPGWTIWTGPWPGGETLADVAARAGLVVERARATSGRVLAFAHGHLIRAVALRWAGLPPEAGGALALDPARLVVLGTERDDEPVIRLWNARP
ncbi:MAG: histidine phosphatase family protein [Anaeromyxobacter sp.]